MKIDNEGKPTPSFKPVRVINFSTTVKNLPFAGDSLEIKDIEGILVSSDYTGFAEEQTENFIKDEIAPILSKYKYDIVEKREELKV